MSRGRKVVLIGNFLPDRQESMQRFADVLAQGFTARQISVEIWRPEPGFVKWVSHYRYGGVPKYLGYLDKFVRFPRTLRRRLKREPAGTVFHILDHGNAVYAPYFKGHPLLVTVHDLLQIRSALGEFPGNRPGRSGRQYQLWILKNLRRLKLAACVSRKTEEDLQRVAGLSKNCTSVVLNGLNYPYSPMPATEAAAKIRTLLHSEPGTLTSKVAPYVVGIGGAQWYKNRTGLLKIFAELKRLSRTRALRLVYVGPPFDADQEKLISEYNMSGEIVRLASVQNEELRAIYSLAEGLIFPSWEEGFGWPIAEAQACGCPVFTSNRAPMTEVGGSAAVYFDPADAATAATKIEHSLENSQPLRVAGLAEARRWDAQQMLDAYLSLYTLMLTAAGASPSRVS